MTAFDLGEQGVDRVHRRVDLPIELIVGNEPPDSSVTGAGVTDQCDSFLYSQVRIVVDRCVGHELSERAFAAVDAFCKIPEFIAENLKVCDEVVCARHDLTDVALLGALYRPAIGDYLSGLAAPSDVDRGVAEKADG